MLTITLPPGNSLTVTAPADAAGNAWPFAEHLGDLPGVTPVAAGASATLGPFATVKRYGLENLTFTVTAVDYPTAGEADNSAAALIATAKAQAIAAALAAQPAVIGTLGDLCEVIGAGVPDATAQAALTVDPTGADNSLVYTAIAYGAAGNAISIEYVDSGASAAPLAVSVVGSAISVSLATLSSVITSTAADIASAIAASAAANALVTVANDGVDDGSGVVTAMAAASLANGAGVAIGVAGKGSRYTDVTNGTLYLNTGTKAVPVWTQLAPVA